MCGLLPFWSFHVCEKLKLWFVLIVRMGIYGVLVSLIKDHFFVTFFLLCRFQKNKKLCEMQVFLGAPVYIFNHNLLCGCNLIDIHRKILFF